MSKLLRIREVTDRTGLSRTSIWRLERDGEFPGRVRIASHAVAWREDEVQDWIDSRPRENLGEDDVAA